MKQATCYPSSSCPCSSKVYIIIVPDMFPTTSIKTISFCCSGRCIVVTSISTSTYPYSCSTTSPSVTSLSCCNLSFSNCTGSAIWFWNGYMIGWNLCSTSTRYRTSSPSCCCIATIHGTRRICFITTCIISSSIESTTSPSGSSSTRSCNIASRCGCVPMDAFSLTSTYHWNLQWLTSQHNILCSEFGRCLGISYYFKLSCWSTSTYSNKTTIKITCIHIRYSHCSGTTRSYNNISTP